MGLPLNKIIEILGVWRNSTPTEVKCFSWLVVRKACLTNEALRKKGKIIHPWCSLCGKTGDEQSPIFTLPFHNPNLVLLNISEVKWTMPGDTAYSLSCWIRRGASKRQKTWWNLIPHCIWRTVWKERNSRNFEDIPNSTQKLNKIALYLYFFGVNRQD